MKKLKKRLTATMLTMLMATSTLAIQPSDTYAATKQVQTIALNTKSKELYVGQKIALSVKRITPSKLSRAVTWKTSNKKLLQLPLQEK